MLIHTAEGWKRLQRPTASLREAVSDERRFQMRVADDLAQLCPSFGRDGAEKAAAALTRSTKALRGR